MSQVPNHAYVITLNEKPIVAIFCNSYYSTHIMTEMRDDHFEEIYGMPISQHTAVMEEQYEKEYAWSFVEVAHLTTKDAESKYPAIISKLGE